MHEIVQPYFMLCLTSTMDDILLLMRRWWWGKYMVCARIVVSSNKHALQMELLLSGLLHPDGPCSANHRCLRTFVLWLADFNWFQFFRSKLFYFKYEPEWPFCNTFLLQPSTYCKSVYSCFHGDLIVPMAFSWSLNEYPPSRDMYDNVRSW